MRHQCTCTLFCTSDVFLVKIIVVFLLHIFIFPWALGFLFLRRRVSGPGPEGTVLFWPFGLQGDSGVRTKAVMVSSSPLRLLVAWRMSHVWVKVMETGLVCGLLLCFLFIGKGLLCKGRKAKLLPLPSLLPLLSTHAPHRLCPQLLPSAALIKHLDVLSSSTLGSWFLIWN